jgi:molybdenum cofactor biosynthesis protein A
MLIDNHGRQINYLRMAITDRCNLRCLYCMPQQGLEWEKRSALLTYEEIMRLLKIYAALGITKLRFTGGEPFLRKDFMQLLRTVVHANLFEQISITTNGTLTAPHVEELKDLQIHSVNLSADTLNADRFFEITRRNDFAAVQHTLDLLLQHGITTRINAIIMNGRNEEDILALALLTKDLPIDVRFIEEMPFNGTGRAEPLKWNYTAIMDEVKKHFPTLTKLQDEYGSTSLNYSIPNHQGRVGVIPAYTRSFCGTCNRVRVTPAGKMKTCLYDEGNLDLRALLRNNAINDDAIAQAISQGMQHRAANGFEAEAMRKSHKVQESMATIGG